MLESRLRFALAGRCAKRLRTRLSLCQGRRAAVAVLAWLRSRIEAAAPAPLVDVDRDAGADPDRADLHVAIENLPAFSVGVFRAAARQRGHGAIEARRGRRGKLSIYWAMEQRGRPT